ncbi:MAG TPA: PSD1 and planctomycete cytochrome C domain-containing protein [Blastocatellia bacterium]|nr:PSD1 and planctomycete cytochrome C domain-containing protein [Blastocatellia bacterium]
MVIRKCIKLVFLAGVCCLVVFFTRLPRVGAELRQDEAQDISRQAYAILKKNCLACHGAARTSGLDLRTGEGVTMGGDNGPVIVPSDAEASKLFQLVTHERKPTMPPGKKLADAEIETLRRWIEAGAPTDGFEKTAAAPSGDAGKAELARLEDRPITPEERRYWAFQPPRRATPPRVAPADWNKNPIDTFLLSAMKAKGLKPSPRADRRTLVRRAYLDLLGLPPSPEEVAAFEKDTAPDAWERLLERLLASPHYGERWARHWLDLVRYADSGGFEFDVDRPDAWRYRDYVVKSFNDDKPYDQFVKEQLAGDEYAPDSQEAMIATGFLRLGPEGGGGGERGRQDSLDDIITTTTLTFLGLTVGCARCHNHKFDPIPQKDYYRIQAVFYSTRPASYPLVGADVVAAHRAETQRIESMQRPLKKAKSDLEAPYLKALVEEAVSRLPEYMQIAWRTPPEKRTPGQRLNVQQIRKTLEDDALSQKLTEKDIVARMTPEDRRRHEELVEQIKTLERQKPKPYPTARAIGEDGPRARPSYFLHRGSVDAKGSLVSPGVLSVACESEYQFPAPPANAKSSFRRRGFAEWLVAPDNPLTARVMVNRIWQHHFGEGIVRTPGNFGRMGEPPTHPELLDWLATEFVARGWSIKQMHRQMMTSQAYQMASNDTPANAAIDPENRFFWRMPRVRLEAEIIRDQILAVAGNLDRTLGGPCVYPYIDPKLFQSSTKRTWPGKPDDDPSTWRRSLYVYSKRSIRYPLFEAFDQPNLINSCERRNRSTIAPQALLLMNNNFVIMESKFFAERLRKEAGDDARAQAERAFRLTLARAPTAFELTKAVEFIRSGPDGLAGFCQALFNLNEFVYWQ